VIGSNWGSLILFYLRVDRKVQEETQDRTKRCEVADDSVVVSKSRPEKPGNRVEEKTGMTCDRVYRGHYEPKAIGVCEGRKFIRRFQDLY
jgi:hypothetical protein